jgi:hypothetical protein
MILYIDVNQYDVDISDKLKVQLSICQKFHYFFEKYVWINAISKKCAAVF